MQFVKGIDRKPKKEVFIKIEGTKAIGHWSTHHEMFINESGDFFPEDQIEWLDEDIPASIEQEAERLYPDGENHAQVKRSAHITAARQYMGEIERLRTENEKYRKALEEIQAEKRKPGEYVDRWAFNRCWHIATEALKGKLSPEEIDFLKKNGGL